MIFLVAVSGKRSSELHYPNDYLSPNHHHEGLIPDRHMTIDDMTCDFFTQPLNHFVPRGQSPTYQERYCTYDGYASTTTTIEPSPIFFYTGNESPLEQYINQTGLMWELAPKYKARVVFVEHRYEGQSLPNITKDCMSYASTVQALADYANILEKTLNPRGRAPVIVFGGSYGGMLSGWMRMKYPHLVAGAIAASAPIGAFPQTADDKIDGSARVLAAGLDQPFPPTTATDDESVAGTEVHDAKSSSPHRSQTDAGKKGRPNHCRTNLLAAWPLIVWLAQNGDNAEFLQRTFSLCNPLKGGDAMDFLAWAQGIWFDLAEGSFPYPSSYIPFALLHKKINLPAWPMQAACWQVSQLYKDWGVRLEGNISDVRYDIHFGGSNISLRVDWDTVEPVGHPGTDLATTPQDSNEIVGLLTSVRDSVSIWYNITKDVRCYNISEVAPNTRLRTRRDQAPKTSFQRNASFSLARALNLEASVDKINPAHVCHGEMKKAGSWGPLCCNDEMNLVITEARGLGNDFFWPPSLPRGVQTYTDMIRNTTSAPCPDPYGIFGYSKEPYDLWSTWLDTYYGGDNMNGHSNIIFSNGLLDPWSAGGVYKQRSMPKYDQWRLLSDQAFMQNITNNDVVALIIPYGGHHTDLMYSSIQDPTCVTQARDIEEQYIAKWIKGWKN